jgi:hypothetical protein
MEAKSGELGGQGRSLTFTVDAKIIENRLFSAAPHTKIIDILNIS